jgi:hypothetical protein
MDDAIGIIQSEPEESKECQILHNQLMETEKELLEIRVQRDYWHRESIKYCAELGEIRIKLGSKQ